MVIPVIYAQADVNDLQNLVKQIVSISVGIGFLALTVMLFWAGIKFITSGGDPKGLTQAKQTMLWAVVGILFLALAIIVLILIKTFTGANVTTFCINTSPCS